MVASVSSPEDVVNLALVRIGWKKPIGNLYDGSAASMVALRIYAQTRDAVLREGNWGFAQRVAAGVPAGSPPFQWAQQYAYPSDCLKVRAVVPSGYAAGSELNPLPTLWEIGNALVSAAQARVIWSQTLNAEIVYTGQITDMTTWDTLFVEAVAAALGRRLAVALADLNTAKAAAEDEATEAKDADMVEG